MRRPALVALGGALTSAVVLLSTVGLAAAQTDAIATRDQALQSITDGLTLIDNGQAKIVAGQDWLAANPGTEDPPPTGDPEPPADETTATATVIDDRRAKVDWTTTRTDITGWHIGRDGTDTSGYGAWSTDLPAETRTFTFDLLRAGDTYTFTLTPKTAAGDLDPVTASVAMGETTPDPTDEPDPTEPPTGDGTEAAVIHNWGTPLAQWSDEFNYQGPVDPAKWEVPNGCWPGHDGNGRRCGENSVVDGSKLVMTGEANADTAWVRSTQDADYGRWEIRMRSETTGPSGNPYHILALLWPSSERWPEDGEFDWVENFDPDANCVSSFIHYPHRAGIPVQQEYAEKCPVDANTWTNYAVEWTPQHVKGFVNGEEWFSWSGGANADRRDIQDMQPEGQLTFQVDAFYPGNMRPAKMEVDWMRTYSVQ